MFSYLKIKFENDKIFKNGQFTEMYSETVSNITPYKIKRTSIFKVLDNIVSATTIKCIIDLRQFENDKIIALNFANAMVAGGGYIGGGNAQEESLCRSSLLYYLQAESIL